MCGSLVDIPQPVSVTAAANAAVIRHYLGDGMDVAVKEFSLANGQPAVVFYIDGMVDKDTLNRDIVAPLVNADKKGFFTVAELAEGKLHLGSVTMVKTMAEVIDAVLQGLIALFVEGDGTALLTEAVSWPQRSVEEPGTDVVVRGPREGFIEAMRPNVTLLRRRIHHPDLRVETVRIGRYTHTDVALVYISSVADAQALALLRKRLAEIDIDAVLDSGSVEQFIEDSPGSVFPTVGVTEKPDIAAAKMLEGRIAVIVDGSPAVLTVPMLFVEGLQSPEDYYTRTWYACWVRLIRGAALFLSVFLPGIFVAACTWHQQIIPFRLFLSIAAAEAQTPFSVGFSLLLIGVVYEVLREAGIRLPKPAGQAISIVGAIVMGDAAVSAGLISAPVLITLAITVVASFVAVTFVDSSTLLWLIFLFLGWAFGFFGIFAGSLFLLVYLCSLESFGLAYFAPFGPVHLPGLRDSLFRAPLWLLKLRPRHMSANRRRVGRMKERRP